MNLISLDNGNKFLTPAEALEVMTLAEIVENLDTNSEAYIATDSRFNGETDIEWLEMFLNFHGGDYIIG